MKITRFKAGPYPMVYYQNPSYDIDEKILLEGTVDTLKQLCEGKSGEELRPLYIHFLEFIYDSNKIDILNENIESIRSIPNMKVYREETFSRADKMVEEFNKWAEYNHKDSLTFYFEKNDLYVDGTSLNGLTINVQRRR